MVHRESTKGYEGYQKSVEELYKDKNTQLFLYFTADFNAKGDTWCPDCNNAKPIIEKAIEQFAAPEAIFLTVEVGDLTFWKNKSNPFRGDDNIKVNEVPTIIGWKTAKRLNGDQCEDLNLLKKLFTDL